MYPTHSVINIENLKSNFLNIRKKVKKTRVLAVVKADSYGHGVKDVVNALNSLGDKKPDFFAVASFDEGIEVRKLKVSQPILIFTPLMEEFIPTAIKYDLSLTFNSPLQLSALEKLKGKKKLKIHIKIDTGMGRLGLDYDNAIDVIKKLEKNKNVLIEGIYSSFCNFGCKG